MTAGKSRERADHASERVTRHAQATLRQAERARRVIVLGDCQEGMADERVAIEQFQPDDDNRTGEHRQPVLLIESAAHDIEDARKRLRLRAPLDRGVLLDDQRERERREHVEVLVEAFQHWPHRHDFGDDAEQRAACERQDEAERNRHARAKDEQRAEHATNHPEGASRKAEHPRGREHHVIGDADQRVDAADRHSGRDDRFDHRLKRRRSRGPN